MSKSELLVTLIAKSIVLMLIVVSAVSVIMTGPDSPGYNACGLLRSRQRDYGSPLHPSGGYTAPHAAPLLRAPRPPSIAPTFPESCACIRGPEAEKLRLAVLRGIRG